MFGRGELTSFGVKVAKTAARPRALPAMPAERTAAVRRVGRLWPLVACALTLLALVLRAARLDHESLWLDEGYTLLFSHMAFPRLILVGGAHEHPPLYYLIVHTLLGVHDSYLVPRAISVVCGSASVLVLFALGRRLYGPLAGAIAAGLLAISPFHLWFSQDGRGYELAGLLVLLSYLFLFTALDRPRWTAWALYATCTALSLYAEYTTAFVLVAQLLLLRPAYERGLTRSLLLAWLGAGLAFLPWVGILALDVASIAGSYWIPPPDPHVVANTMLEFLGVLTPCPSPPCSGHEIGASVLGGHEVLLAAVTFAAVLATGAVAARLRDLRTATLVLWMVAPFALILLISLRWSLYLDRVFLDATFPLYLLAGAGVAGAGRLRAVWAAAALAIGVTGIANLQPIYAGGTNPDWRSASRDFAAAYRPGQAVVFNPGVLQRLVGAYLPAGFRAGYEVPLWSRSYIDVPGWPRSYAGPAHPTADERRRVEARLRDWQLARAVRGHERVWLVTYDYSGMNDSRRWFVLHGFQLALSEEYAGDTRIELWQRSPEREFGAPVYADSFASAWSHSGTVKVSGAAATENGRAFLARTFPIRPGNAYSVNVEYRGVPPAHPVIWLQTTDANDRAVAMFPRTQWYDWPVTGIWLSQPFGFVAPPGAVHATLWLGNLWGVSSWRHVVVYRER